MAMVAVMASPAAAAAKRSKNKGPTQITPAEKKGKQRRQERRADVDRSDGGTRQGVLELTLGSITGATSLLLVARGIWELREAEQLARDCAAQVSDAIECGFLNPARGGRIAAGLSFGFAVPIGLASGFLLARGIRIHRDYRKWTREHARLRLQPWASVRHRGGGLTVELRF